LLNSCRDQPIYAPTSSDLRNDDLTLAWYDETTGQWIDVGGTVNKKKKYVKVKINHFTQYTLSVR
jgi:hypothetical protein